MMNSANGQTGSERLKALNIQVCLFFLLEFSFI